jgi:hypothetical protein
MKRALTAVAVALGATPISAYELANHATPTWHRVRRHGWEFRSERRRGASVRARCSTSAGASRENEYRLFKAMTEEARTLA